MKNMNFLFLIYVISIHFIFQLHLSYALQSHVYTENSIEEQNHRFLKTSSKKKTSSRPSSQINHKDTDIAIKVVKSTENTDDSIKDLVKTTKKTKSSSKTSKKVVISNPQKRTDTLYYISTDEGILSHLRQLEILWNIANSVGKKLIVVGFQSHHYPNLKNILLCDYFLLPSNITCTSQNSTEIFNQEKCIYTGHIFPPKHYKFPTSLETSQTFRYEDINCIAGGIVATIGVYDAWHRSRLVKKPFFHEKYQKILPYIRKYLGLGSSDENYAVVHWRRGDQLKTRCIKYNDNKKHVSTDTSVNCGSAEEFVVGLNQIMSQHLKSEVLLTYISTNEEDKSNIMYLKSKKYRLYSDIGGDLLEKFPETNVLDIFMYELMLMCDAKYYFAWGESSVHQFVHKCRNIDPQKVTVIDDPKVPKHSKSKSKSSTSNVN